MGRRLRRWQGAGEDQGCEQHSPHGKIMTRAKAQRDSDSYNLSMTSDRQLLRHTVATLAYRAGKALRGAPATFADFTVAAGTRTPVQIVAHMGDLLDWALYLARGEHTWHDSMPLPWDQEIA